MPGETFGRQNVTREYSDDLDMLYRMGGSSGGARPRILTMENKSELENMYRRMCFNVFAHNRDDHAKNFTFLYDESEERWHLSPAYDLTYSNTYFGEHTTSVDGNGKNPGEKELVNVGMQAGMKKKSCVEIMEQVRSIVQQDLRKYKYM